MSKEYVIVAFESINMANNVYRIIRMERPKWRYCGREIRIPTSIRPDLSIVFTSAKRLVAGDFKGYRILHTLSYRPYSLFCPGSPEELIEEIEGLMLGKEKEEVKG